jgi:hypothetical protein
VVFKEFFCDRAPDATIAGVDRYFAEVSSAASPANPECFRSFLQVFLGCDELPQKTEQ